MWKNTYSNTYQIHRCSHILIYTLLHERRGICSDQSIMVHQFPGIIAKTYICENYRKNEHVFNHSQQVYFQASRWLKCIASLSQGNIQVCDAYLDQYGTVFSRQILTKRVNLSKRATNSHSSG